METYYIYCRIFIFWFSGGTQAHESQRQFGIYKKQTINSAIGKEWKKNLKKKKPQEKRIFPFATTWMHQMVLLSHINQAKTNTT